MKITLDKEADAMYIELGNEEFATNKKMDEETIIDLDSKGKIIGIEILNVSKRMTKNFLADIRFQNLISEKN
jgi:uncharacterized protein YuzE